VATIGNKKNRIEEYNPGNKMSGTSMKPFYPNR